MYLLFECVACGACCRREGNVPLYPEDVKIAANACRISVADFVARYTNYVFRRFEYKDGVIEYPILELKNNGMKCVLLDGNRCSIHNGKPFICRNGPFVFNIIGTRIYWQKFKSTCQGLGRGRLITSKEIRTMLECERELDEKYLRKLEDCDYILEDLVGTRLPEPQITVTQFNTNYADFLKQEYINLAYQDLTNHNL